MAECQQSVADEPVFSINLANFFQENATEIQQIDHTDIPDEILYQFTKHSMPQNSEINQHSVNAAADNVAENTLKTNRF